MNKEKYRPFPVLQTARLTLRQLTENDSPQLFSLRCDKRVNKYLDRPEPNGMNEITIFISIITNGIHSGKWIYWAIDLKNSAQLMGTVCLWNFSEDETIAELGYELLPHYQQHGFMDEAVKKVIEYAFDVLKLKKIRAFTHKENAASVKLLVKNGFAPDNSVIPENSTDCIYCLNKI